MRVWLRLRAFAEWKRAPSPGFVSLRSISPPSPTGRGYPLLLASSAIFIASPASTVPISQRCTSSLVGRVPRNAAIEPAASAIIALTLTLIAIWIEPSASDTVSTLPPVGSRNPLNAFAAGQNERQPQPDARQNTQNTTASTRMSAIACVSREPQRLCTASSGTLTHRLPS